MSDLVTKIAAEIGAEKNRLLHERDKLDYRINALSAVMMLVQKIECPEGGADQTRPEPEPSEEPQAAPAPTSLTPAPAADHGYGYEEEGLLAEKAAPKRSFPVAKRDTPNPSSPYVTRPAAPATGKKPAPTKKGAAEPISFNDLIAKAAEWGITQDRDWAPSTLSPAELLSAVNEKAKRIGHPLYALQSRSP